jgi:hypothetical protein
MAGPFDFEQEQKALDRKRAIAQAMMMQSLQQPGGTEYAAGGVAVKRSPFEGLAKIAQTFASTQAMKGLDEQGKDLSTRQRGDIADAIEEYTRQTQSREIQAPTFEGMTGSLDEQDIPTKRETINPDATMKRSAAMTLMGKIGDPKDAAKLMVADALRTPEIKAYKPGDVLMRDGVQVGAIPDKPDKVKKSDLAILIEERDALPADSPQRATYDAKIKKLTTHQPGTTVNVDAKTEKKYGEKFAEAIAKSDVDLLEAARKAPELAERANSIKQTLATGKVITGAGADIRLSLGKALNLVGATDAETISNTESLSTSLARNTLDSIKASGLGSGSGFSNADRDFLEKAAGGKITLEAGTIDKLADLAHRAAEKSAGRWSERVNEIPDSALQGTGIKRDPVRVTPLFKKPAKGQQPQGRRASDAPLPPEVEAAMKKYL